MFKELFTESKNYSKMNGTPKDYGVQEIAGISNYLDNKDNYLKFNFDFSEEQYKSFTASFYLDVYNGKLKIQITGREDFKKEIQMANNQFDDIKSSKFMKGINKIVKVSWSKQSDGYAIKSSKISDDQQQELYTYIKKFTGL